MVCNLCPRYKVKPAALNNSLNEWFQGISLTPNNDKRSKERKNVYENCLRCVKYIELIEGC